MTKIKKNNAIPRELFVEAGKRGGDKTAKRGKKFYKEIGTKGAKKRWSGGEKIDVEIPKSED